MFSQDYEPQYRQASEQLHKMSLNLQDASTELSKSLQENGKLQSRVTLLESEVRPLAYFLLLIYFLLASTLTPWPTTCNSDEKCG